MNRSSSRAACLLAALLVAAACTTAPVSRPSSSSATPPVPSPTGPAPAPEEEPEARALLAKALEAMGGARAVDRVQTMVLTGKVRQLSALGEYEATVTTTFLYPDKMKRDVVLPSGGTVSSVFTPEAAWMAGALGSVELAEAEKRKLEAVAMRNPVSLLKSRNHPLFRISRGGPAAAVGEGRDNLVIRMADLTTDVLLGGDHRIIELSYEAPPTSPDAKKDLIRVVYSDFRPAEGLVYPFSSETFAGNAKVSSFVLDSVRVNQPVPPSLFERPGPAPMPRPSPPVP